MTKYEARALPQRVLRPVRWGTALRGGHKTLQFSCWTGGKAQKGHEKSNDLFPFWDQPSRTVLRVDPLAGGGQVFRLVAIPRRHKRAGCGDDLSERKRLAKSWFGIGSKQKLIPVVVKLV